MTDPTPSSGQEASAQQDASSQGSPAPETNVTRKVSPPTPPIDDLEAAFMQSSSIPHTELEALAKDELLARAEEALKEFSDELAEKPSVAPAPVQPISIPTPPPAVTPKQEQPAPVARVTKPTPPAEQAKPESIAAEPQPIETQPAEASATQTTENEPAQPVSTETNASPKPVAESPVPSATAEPAAKKSVAEKQEQKTPTTTPEAPKKKSDSRDTRRKPYDSRRSDSRRDDRGRSEQTPEPTGPSVVVRYGMMKMIGEFRYTPKFVPTPGMKVVVRTDRGVELGTVVAPVTRKDTPQEPKESTDDTSSSNCNCSSHCSPLSLTGEKLNDFLKTSGEEYPFRRGGRVLRKANQQDLIDFRHFHHSAKETGKYCRQRIKDKNLPMRLVTVEHLLGGERIVFYFSAENRVDFRELVRELASQFRTRIEMRQVGARDEARLVGDYERCGQRCCCQQFLKHLKPISMRMAKVQKATLDPSKISGRCGRLMCCLRYEDETYEDLRKKLPKRGTWVRTETLLGRVLDGQIITQLVRLALPDGSQEAIPIEELTERNLPEPTEEEFKQAIRDIHAARRANTLHASYQKPDDLNPAEDDDKAFRAFNEGTDTEKPADQKEPSDETRPGKQQRRGRRPQRNRRGDSEQSRDKTARPNNKNRRRRRRKPTGQGEGQRNGGQSKGPTQGQTSKGDGNAPANRGDNPPKRRRRRRRKPGGNGGGGTPPANPNNG